MAYSGWKRFRFFQEEAHADAVLPSNVSCSCSLGGSIWLGCSDGLAVCVAHDLSVRATFQAHAVRLDHVSAVQVRWWGRWSSPGVWLRTEAEP